MACPGQVGQAWLARVRQGGAGIGLAGEVINNVRGKRNNHSRNPLQQKGLRLPSVCIE